jgi:hypothetical protein
LSALDRARAVLDVPFQHQGRNPAVGLDCIGLLAHSFAGTPYASHDATDYAPDPHDGLLESRLRAAFGEPVFVSPARVAVPLDVLQPGDVVALRYEHAIRHVGLVGSIAYGRETHLTLIHTDNMVGRVVEHRIDFKWARRIALVFRPFYPVGLLLAAIPEGAFMTSFAGGGYSDPEKIA